MTPKIVFMGSPEFAVKILQALAEKYKLTGVVTQPDRPAGRGKIITRPPVKVVADQLQIPTIQPERLKEPAALAQLQSWNPDVIVVAAFGQILRQNVLDLPRFGCVNVHASFLPRWRGAAPIQASIMNGDEYTGITIMKMDAGIDTGPILLQEKVKLDPEETYSTLSEKLAVLGGPLLLKALPQYFDGTLLPQNQPETDSTYASMISKEDGKLDFSQSATEIDRKVRALNDWPGTYVEFDHLPLKIRKVEPVLSETNKAGKRGVHNKLPAISTRDGWILLKEVQPAGKKWMNGADFLRGVKNWIE